MATATIGQLTLATSALDTDLMEMEVAASGVSHRITKKDWIGATLSGGGSIATGGFSLALSGNTVISGGGALALGGFSLTVPATGVADIVDATQTLTNKTLTAPAISAPVITGRLRLNSGAVNQDAMSEAIAIGTVGSTQTVTIDITAAAGQIGFVTDFALSLLRSASAGVYGLAYGKVSWSGTGGGAVTIRDSLTSFRSSGTVTGSVSAITGGIRISITSSGFGNTLNANTFSHTTTGVGANLLTVTVTIS